MESPPTPFEAVEPYLGTDEAFLEAMQDQELWSAIHALAEAEHLELLSFLLARITSDNAWVKQYALELAGFHYRFARAHPLIEALFDLISNEQSDALDDVGVLTTAVSVLAVHLRDLRGHD